MHTWWQKLKFEPLLVVQHHHKKAQREHGHKYYLSKLNPVVKIFIATFDIQLSQFGVDLSSLGGIDPTK